MGSYSSDSDDSSTRGRKTRRRSRSTGRSSSHRSKHSSSRHKERSPSSRYRSRRSRSYSRDRSRYTKHRRSRSREAYRKRSRSRDKRDRKKDKRSRHKKRSTSRNRSSRRSTSSSSSSSESSPGRKSDKGSSEKALRDKLLDTIKAASAVDARAKEANVPINVKSCNDFDLLPPIKPDPDAIRDIEEEHFAPKAFKSSKIKDELPDVKPLAVERKIPEKTVFHSSFFEDSQEKMDRWVKKLFQIRQRALNGGSPQ